MVSRVMSVAALMLLHSVSTSAIEPAYEAVAQYVGVPPDILYAMSKAESGMLKNNRFGPWPWTLNIAGAAKRYENRQSMFEGLMDALRAGELRIDVGPMQVNWYWQFELVGSPWRITDPTVNIKTAAYILKTHYAKSGDWWEAVGRYHRPADGPKDKAIAEQYRRRVRHFYHKNTQPKADADAA